MSYTLVQLHFVRGMINHRLRFGQPEANIKLDEYRTLALFPDGSIFGYVRWRANEYGTIAWRVYVLKAQAGGYLSHVVGITPAVKILVSAQGRPAVKRCFTALDKVEKDAGGALDLVPESYWTVFNNALSLRKSPRQLPRNIIDSGASYAR